MAKNERKPRTEQRKEIVIFPCANNNECVLYSYGRVMRLEFLDNLIEHYYYDKSNKKYNFSQIPKTKLSQAFKTAKVGTNKFNLHGQLKKYAEIKELLNIPKSEIKEIPYPSHIPLKLPLYLVPRILIKTKQIYTTKAEIYPYYFEVAPLDLDEIADFFYMDNQRDIFEEIQDPVNIFEFRLFPEL